MGNSSAAFGFPAKTGSIAISAYKLRTNGHFSAFLWLLFPCTSLHGMERKAQDFQRFSAYQMVLVCTGCILPYITPWRLVRMRSPVQIWLAAPENPGFTRETGCFFNFFMVHFVGRNPVSNIFKQTRFGYALAPRICDIWSSGAASSGEFFISCIKAATAGSVTGDAASFSSTAKNWESIFAARRFRSSFMMWL